MITAALTFAMFGAKSFDEIQLSVAGNATILGQILRVVGRVAAETRAAPRREVLVTPVRLVLGAMHGLNRVPVTLATVVIEKALLKGAAERHL